MAEGGGAVAGLLVSCFLGRFDSVSAVDSSLTGPPSNTPESPGHSAKSPRRRRLAIAGVALGALLLTGCQLPTFGAYKGATSQGRSTFHLWQGFFIASLVVGGFVAILITWAIFRYRRRNDDIPRQTQYHTLTEIIYTISPILIVIGLFIATVLVENEVTAEVPHPYATIHVYAFQWGWEFQYDNGVKVIGQTTDAPTMVVPTDETVRGLPAVLRRAARVLHTRIQLQPVRQPRLLHVVRPQRAAQRGVSRAVHAAVRPLPLHHVLQRPFRDPGAYQTWLRTTGAFQRTHPTPSGSCRRASTAISTAPRPATLGVRAPATVATQEVRYTVTDVIAPGGAQHPEVLVPSDGHDAHVGHEDHGPSGILKWLTSTDHKVIGLSYMITAIAVFYISGVMALLMRIQLTTAHSSFLSFSQFNALFTMHGSLMMYLFAGPIAFGGLANYVVPLQIGAPDMAFPRLNALSYWLFLGGSITMLLSFFVAGGAAQFGWVAYAPLSSATSSPGAGPDLWIMALVLTGFSAIFTGVNLCANDLLPACARHDDVAHADLHLEHAGDRDPDPDRVPGAHRGAGHAVLRPPLRDPHLYGGGLSASSTGRHGVVRVTVVMAEPLLVLRPSRGLHPRPALLRHRDRDPARLLPPAGVRLQGHGLRHHGDRRPVHRRVGAPHVHHRRGAAAVLLVPQPADRGADRHQVLQLDRHHVARPADVHHPDAVLYRVPVRVPDGRGDRHHAGVAADRLRHPRHLLRGGPLPSGAVRDGRVRRVRRRLLLVSQDVRPDASRQPRQVALLADVHRFLGHLHAPVRRRLAGDASPGGQVPVEPRAGRATTSSRRSAPSSSASRSCSCWSTSSCRGASPIPAGDNPWDAHTLEWFTTSPPPHHNYTHLPPIRSERPTWDYNHPEHIVVPHGREARRTGTPTERSRPAYEDRSPSS